MAEIVFRRIFHPVGQGAFFTEQLLDSSDGVIANVVYDCGSRSPGISSKMKHEIDNMFEEKNKIDALFLSHFDDDHINYVDYLCTQNYMNGAKMFVPLLVEEKYLEATFVKDNYAKLDELANRYGIQIVKVKFDNIDSNPNADPVFFDDVHDTIESGTKLMHKKYPLWYWVPFNIKNEELIKEFKDKLDFVDLDSNKLENDDNYILNNIKELKNVYRSLTKIEDIGYGTSINLNSLQLLSYPARIDICKNYERYSIEDSYFGDYYRWNLPYLKYKFEKENLYPGSCLYTGDTSSNSDIIWNTLMKKIDQYLGRKVVLFQIPHHGSKRSNDDRIVKNDKIYALFTNFDPDYFQKIFDPELCLLFYLKQKPLILVTKEDEFRFEENWMLN